VGCVMGGDPVRRRAAVGQIPCRQDRLAVGRGAGQGLPGTEKGDGKSDQRPSAARMSA
jgi:hypothetical protein